MTASAQESQFKGPILSGLSTSAQPGERMLVSGPLSKDGAYRLLVTGTVGAKELGKIIKLLTVYKEMYADDDEEAESAPES